MTRRERRRRAVAALRRFARDDPVAYERLVADGDLRDDRVAEAEAGMETPHV